ncbi:MAG: signal peptidase I [Candidatus Bathyarchaeota archaeon]|nr:signal peptidase I [Candidatus Bathyarchaeota archaeon]
MPQMGYDLPTEDQPSENPEYNLPDEEEKKPEEKKEKSAFVQIMSAIGRFLYEVIKTTAIIIIVAFLIRYFLIQPFVVEGESMEPNFHNNEYLIIQKVSGYFNKYNRGDVIVFQYPKNPEISYIKRIIGLPGEKIKFDQGEVTIFNSQNPKGKELIEDYVLSTFDETNLTTEKTLSENEYYVLGDNRNNSSDSREWGPLEKKYIQGKALIRLYPFSEAGFASSPQYSY